MIPDRLQYILDDFWNFEKFVKIWTRRPPTYYQNAPKHTRKLWEHPGKDYLCKYGTQKIAKLLRCCESYMYRFVFVFLFLVSHLYIVFYEDEDRENIKIGLIKSRKAWT